MSVRIIQISEAIGTGADAAGRWIEAHWPWLPVITLSFLLLLAAGAPLLAAAGASWLSDPIYWALGHVCHQRPERSLWLAGHPMALCARDIGLLGGAGLAAWLFLAWRRIRIPGWLVLLCLVPLTLDGGTQLVGLRESSNILRLITGLLAGLPALLYILRHVNGQGPSCPDVDRRPALPVSSHHPARQDRGLNDGIR